MADDLRRDRGRYTWRPGRGFAGGAVTGVWFALVLAALTAVVDLFERGWRLGLVAVVAGDLVGTLVVAVPVLALVGGALRASSRPAAVGAYAAAALVVRLLLGPLLESAVGSTSSPGGAQVAVLAVVAVVAGIVAATVSTRDRLPRTSGLLTYRAGGPPRTGNVPGASAAPAPAGRYLSGGP
ncbi:hypothetical protein GCM10009817_31960 [Terrabacter lapilli]|uniref:Uncharacterized protein n=1 Tax=Terrabacter lapilli TaxID=436231 RepID=A0ABP5DZ33_9MICO